MASMAYTEPTPMPATAPASKATSVQPNGSLAVAPRKFKASELPLSSATRSAIDSLAHSFKKKGGYDAIRKQIWEKFEASVRLSPLETIPNTLLPIKQRNTLCPAPLLTLHLPYLGL